MIDQKERLQIDNNVEVEYLKAYIGDNYKNIKKGLSLYLIEKDPFHHLFINNFSCLYRGLIIY